MTAKMQQVSTYLRRIVLEPIAIIFDSEVPNKISCLRVSVGLQINIYIGRNGVASTGVASSSMPLSAFPIN